MTEFGKFAEKVLLEILDEGQDASVFQQYLSDYGSLLLVIATKQNKIATVEYLLKHVRPTTKTMGQTDFLQRVKASNEAKDMEQLLIANKLISISELNIYKDPNYIPLYYQLIDNTRPPVVFDNTPLNFASNERVASLLLQHGADVNAVAQNTTLLHNACKTFNIPLIKYLCKLPSLDVNINIAITNENLRGYEYFHDYGTPLHIIINSFRNKDHANEDLRLAMLKLLLKCNPMMDIIGTYDHLTPLAVACDCNLRKIAAELIKAGANVDGADGQSRCPLQCAIIRFDVWMMDLLCLKGATVNRVVDRISMIAQAATLRNMEALNFSILKLLIDKYHADINFVDTEGNNALHSCFTFTPAAGYNISKSIIWYLILIGVDINKRNNNGDTPLLLAVKTLLKRLYFIDDNDLQFIKMMLKLGADIYAENNEHVSPLRYIQNIVNTDMLSSMHITPEITFNMMTHRPTRALTEQMFQTLDQSWRRGARTNSKYSFTENINISKLYSILLDEKQRRDSEQNAVRRSRSRPKSASVTATSTKQSPVLRPSTRYSQSAGKSSKKSEQVVKSNRK